MQQQRDAAAAACAPLEQGKRREKGGQQHVRPLHCRGEGCKQQLQQQRDTAATACAPLRAGAEAGEGRTAARAAIALQGRGV
jgi:hypothetical protein